MIQLNLNHIVKITKGELYAFKEKGELPISSISIDSRTIVDPGSTLFFAIVGERNNGHNYIDDLYSKGVRSFIISENDFSAERYPEANIIQVQDTLQALQELAGWIRKKFHYPVLAITGSNGKTIVKEWLFELLSERKIIRSPKSYNSQVGVPLSVLNMAGQYDLAVFEAGISKPEEMEKLTSVLTPDIGIFTNIGDAHQENFEDLEQKVEEKLKLFETCESLIYCRDHQIVSQKIQAKYQGTSIKLIGWSFKNENAGLFFQLQKRKSSTGFKFKHDGKEQRFAIPFTDEASIENAANCLAFIISQKEFSQKVVEAFGNLQPVAMRLELKEGINNCTLINDYYNSDINSLGIALQFLNQQTTSAKKKTVILSNIQQSGLDEMELIKEVSDLIQLNKIDRFIGIGDVFKRKQGNFNEGEFYESTNEFLSGFKNADFYNESILIKGARSFHFERISAALQKKYHQTRLEIRLHEMIENLNSFRSLLNPSTKIMVMVKAFSYGSGTVEVAKMLQYQKVDYLAVAVADEGIELRQAGIETPIVVMNPEVHSFETMIEYRLEPNIYSEELFSGFEKVAQKLAIRDYPIHLKIDSGMHRLGFCAGEEFENLLGRITESSSLRVKSAFSHLAASDEVKHDAFTQEQYDRFQDLANKLEENIPRRIDKHILNSAGIERFPELQMDMVRLGIGLYGVSAASEINCKPITYWMTVVSQVRKVEQGETIGYSRKGNVDSVREIAVIPVGYADGYGRRFGNGNAKVWMSSQEVEVPTIGNICMDMSMIDVTGLGVEAGDPVELMGEHIHLSKLAQWAGTIPYEILTGISQRVKRVYVQE